MDDEELKSPDVLPEPLSQETIERQDEWAQFKLGLISSVVYRTHDMGSDRKELKRIASKTHLCPDGIMRSYSYQTLARWVRDYKDKGISGLYVKTRSDSGNTRVLTMKAQIRIQEILKQVPTITIAKLGRRLVQEGVIEEGEVSDDTLSRYVLKHGLRNPQVVDVRIRRSFLVREAGFLWESDSLYFIKLRKDKKLRWVFIQGIIDNHTRMIVAAKCYWHDNATNFQATFRSAVGRWHIPVKIYVDNGSPFVNRQLTAICNRLGVTLIHTRSKDGASKGVVERSWLSLLLDTIPDVILDGVDTIEGLQAVVDKYVSKYNTKENSGVGGIPVERYKESEKRNALRKVGSTKELSEMFLNGDPHFVYNDNTVRKWNKKWEVPDDLVLELRKRNDKRVNVYYDPCDGERTIHVVYQEKKYPLVLHDPLANDGKKRNTGGRKAELAEQAKKKEEKKMSQADAMAEERYARRMAGVNDPRYVEDQEGQKAPEDLPFPELPDVEDSPGDLALDLTEVKND